MQFVHQTHTESKISARVTFKSLLCSRNSAVGFICTTCRHVPDDVPSRGIVHGDRFPVISRAPVSANQVGFDHKTVELAHV